MTNLHPTTPRPLIRALLAAALALGLFLVLQSSASATLQL